MNERLIKSLFVGALAFGLVFVLMYIVVPVALVMDMDRDYNPPISEMTAYYNTHLADFARATQILPVQDCEYACEAPGEILAWAGSQAGLYICNGNEVPPMLDVVTEGGTFTYIPDQSVVPTPWRPCVGVFATCSDRIADFWFRCKRSFD